MSEALGDSLSDTEDVGVSTTAKVGEGMFDEL
jgi:hypothetical protein